MFCFCRHICDAHDNVHVLKLSPFGWINYFCRYRPIVFAYSLIVHSVVQIFGAPMGNSTSGGRSWPRDVRDLFRSGSRTSRRHDRSNRHGATDVNDRPRSAADTGRGASTQHEGDGRTNYSKLNSCPDLQGVARSGYTDQQRRQRNDIDQPPLKLNVKIYRSYRFSSTLFLFSTNT